MMHMTKGWSGLRTAVIALSLFAWTTTGVKAAPVPNLLDYSTAGALNLGTNTVSGTNVISFIGVSPSQIDPSSNSHLPLGSFQVAALPDGQSTTYTNTPFQINFIPTSYGGISTPMGDSAQLTGTLNGTVTGSYYSSVTVSLTPGTFELAGVPSSVQILPNDQPLLVPSSAGATSTSPGGITTLEGIVTNGSLNPTEAPAPEPSTIALFLSTIGGLGVRRYVLSRRRQNRA
jgi:hypothetical protein